MPLDSKMPCLCCDRTVVLDMEQWRSMEMPVALCRTCAATVPVAALRALFIMRSHISMMSNEMKLVQGDIKRLYKAQQDLEEAIVAEA